MSGSISQQQYSISAALQSSGLMFAIGTFSCTAISFLYDMNAGWSNVWDKSQYGGTELTNFVFSANFTNRNLTSRGIIGRHNMSELASHISFEHFSIDRPSWPTMTKYVGSTTLLAKYDDATGGEYELFDQGLPEDFTWTETLPYHRTSPLNCLSNDAVYNVYQETNLYYTIFKSLSLGHPSFDNMTYTNCKSTYAQAVSNTLSHTEYDVNEITNIPKVLEITNRWMGAAGQALAFMDSCYTHDFVSGESRYEKVDYTGRISLCCEKDASGCTLYKDGTISPALSISKSDFEVENSTNVIKVSTNTAGLCNIRVSDVVGTPAFAPVAEIFDTVAITFQDIQNVLGVRWGYDTPFEVYFEEDEEGGYFYGIVNVDYNPTTVERYKIPDSIPLDKVIIRSSIEKTYYFYDFLDVLNVNCEWMPIGLFASDNEIRSFGSYVVYEDYGINIGNITNSDIRYAVSKETMRDSKVAVTNVMVDFVINAMGSMKNCAISKWGRYNRPLEYAPVTAEEGAYALRVERGGLSFNSTPGCVLSGTYQNDQESFFRVSDLDVYDESGERIGTIPWEYNSENNAMLATVSYYVEPTVIEFPTVITNQCEQRARGQFELIQRRTFDFPALHLSD